MAQQQTFENHAKVVPAYHYFTFGLIAVYFFYRLYVAVTAFSLDALMSLLLVVALLMVFFWARLFALRVQDRVIRLEMRLRLLRLVPALAPRLDEFTINQLCSLRFASDGGAAGAGREGARRQARRSQGHQTHDPRLAGGSAPRLGHAPSHHRRARGPGLCRRPRAARRRRSGSSTRRQACPAPRRAPWT